MNFTEYKFRIKYKITGRLRFLSHRELMRVMARVFRRAQMPLAYSKGFHPHPLISFGPPRSVAMAGISELIDVKLTESLSPEAIKEALNAQLPLSMEIIQVEDLAQQEKSITAQVSSASYKFEWAETELDPQQAITALQRRATIEVERRGKRGRTKVVDLKPGIINLKVTGKIVEMQLALSPDLHVKPEKVISLMTGWTDATIKSIEITRTAMHFTPKQAGSSNGV